VIHRLELSFALFSHFSRAPSRAASSEQRIVWTGIDSTRTSSARRRRPSEIAFKAHVATEEWWEWNGLSTTTVGRSPRRFVRPGRERAPPARLESRAG